MVHLYSYHTRIEDIQHKGNTHMWLEEADE
jgi:hypothetical protein